MKTVHASNYLDFIADEELVKENRFLAAKPDRSRTPLLAEKRPVLPEPEWPANPDAIACCWKVWDIAFKNLRQAKGYNGFVHPYIDTAFNDCLFMWDSVFILHFARYGSRAFLFQGTLDNLYAKQREDGFIPREVKSWDGKSQFHPHDPCSTGPNVLAWSEWEYFESTGDRERLAAVFVPLLAYHRWWRKYRSWQDGSYWNSGLGCGMDNQVRVGADYQPFTDHGHLSWIDATTQAALSAETLLKMAEVLGRAADVEAERREYAHLVSLVNERMWNEKVGVYADRRRDGTVSDVVSVAGYWPLLAKLAPADRVSRLIALLEDPKHFNRPHRLPSLSASDPRYRGETGSYWLGGVWPPTNYMVLRGLSGAGTAEADRVAFDIARNHHENVVAVFRETGTVWENYSPERAARGEPSKPDFVGWSGIGPVAVLFEYLFGLRPAASENKLLIDVRLTDAYGVKRYPFGPKAELEIAVAARKSPTEKPVVTVRSTHALTVEVRWEGGSETRAVPGGAA